MATKKKTEPKADAGNTVPLTEKEQEGLREIEQTVIRAKLTLADADLACANVERARLDARNQLNKANKAYTDLVLTMAKHHGIDSNDKSQKWTFDTSTMTFIRRT